MIVRRMTANFGVLENRTLELQPGLNIIEAPNEYGKSTWCAFLRTMLYGIDTSQRARGGKKPDKFLYAPWNGTPMSGAIDVEFGGKNITISRSTRTPTAPMRDFSAVYTDTAQAVSSLTAEDAGETLTGMTLPVFERTAFISSGSLGVSQSAELEKKITSLLTTGEESGTFTEVSASLRAAQRKCRYRNTGRLPETEAEMSDIRRRITSMEDTAQKLEHAEEIFQNSHRGENAAEKMPDDSSESRYAAATAELSRCRMERIASEKETAELEEAAAEAKNTVVNGILSGAEPNGTAAEKAKSDERRARDAERTVKAKTPGVWIWISCFLLAGIFALGGFYRKEFWLGTAIFLLTGFVFCAAAVSVRNRKKRAAKVLKSILARYRTDSVSDISSTFEAYRSAWKTMTEREAELSAKRETVRAVSEREFALQDEITVLLGKQNVSEGAAPESDPYREETARLRGRLEALGDPLVLKSRLHKLEEEHSRTEETLRALTLALDELALADEEMQSEFSPALSQRAAEILSHLTNGAYSSLTLDRELNAFVRADTQMLMRESASLSRGTTDQIYLSLRLALCEMLSDGNEPCPIVLDDALINFDDERMGYALDFLSSLSAQRQILLFTCHKREKEYMAAK